jgi:hypothetical protein
MMIRRNRGRAMADRQLTMMCVHGLGDNRDGGWEAEWETALQDCCARAPGLTIAPRFVTYDDIFEGVEISLAEATAAAAKLAASAVSSIRRRGVAASFPERVRWTAGYVVAWVEDEGFRRASRRRMLDAVREHEPDVILAHSLGSLVTFNAFTHDDAAEPDVASVLKKARYVTIGSQLANRFVIRNLTDGEIAPPPVGFWHHLYNEHDDVFTEPIEGLDAARFRQTATPFDLEGVGDHAAGRYIAHPAAIAEVWRRIG